jgi:hypothetical protein
MQRHGGTGKSIDREITDPAAVERNSGSTPIAVPGRTVMLAAIRAGGQHASFRREADVGPRACLPALSN